MALTIQQKEEISEAVKSQRKGHWLLDWTPFALGLCALIGAVYVGVFRLGIAEEDIADLEENKADKIQVEHVVTETDLKLQVIQKDVDNISGSVDRIEDSQRVIIDEIRRIK